MSVDPIVSALLAKRGISREAQESFLHPDFEKDQHDASIMLGMGTAVARVSRAIDSGEKVLIFGDYDADGVPATALLVRTLRALGLDVEPLIPSRAQGYGLTAPIVEELVRRAPALVIAVDNGTVAKDEVAALADAGMDVIVIDHHEPQEGHVAVRALAIINPKQEACPYLFKEMCACGLSWKFIDQLYAARGQNRQALKWELDLVALSTIADMVPLVGENRLLAIYGLKVLRKTRNAGLKALLASAGVEAEKLSAGDVGFKIAPRINAPSRMHSEEAQAGENAAVTLLIGEDEKKCAGLAQHLNARNLERQALVDEHLAEAEIQAAAMSDARVMVVFHESWSTGVIGLVASRLLEKYKRPAIALAPEDGFIKGSVRSVEGVNAVEMLEAAREQLARFGGHAKAAGLTFTESGDVAIFRESLNVHVDKAGFDLEALRLASERASDMELELSSVSLELCDALEELEPFGIGFPRPLFETVCEFDALRGVGAEGKHLSGFLAEGPDRKKMIAFRWGDRGIEVGKRYRVRYSLEAEEWRSVRSPVCHVQEIAALSGE